MNNTTIKRIITPSTVTRIIAAGLLFWAVKRHPFDYFTILRFVVCAVGLYVAYLSYVNKAMVWLWLFRAIAVLFNPLITIRLSRQTWAPIDIGTGIVILISIWFVQEKHRGQANEVNNS
jgi:hypothetical protein